MSKPETTRPAAADLREAATMLNANVCWRREFERYGAYSPEMRAVTDRLDRVAKWLGRLAMPNDQIETTEAWRLQSEVSDACHGKRLDHYLNQYGGKSDGTPARMNSRAQAYDLAHGAATAEMLDEIHLMLRVLTGADK